MGRPRSQTFTEAEQRVLKALWSLGEASVSDIHGRLSEHGAIAYTTVLTMVGVLCQKGYAARRKDGRAHLYRALVSEAEVRRQALQQVLGRFFDGSPAALARHLLEEDALDPGALKALRAEITRARKRSEAKS